MSEDDYNINVTVRGHTLYPVHYDDAGGYAHDGGRLAQRFSRQALASLHLPGVYVDERGWFVCFTMPRIAAILLVEAAVILARHALIATANTLPPGYAEIP